MWVTRQDDSEAFWSYQDLAIFLGLALPCLLGGAFLVKAALFSIALGVGLAIGLGCKEMAAKYVGQLIDSFRSTKR